MAADGPADSTGAEAIDVWPLATEAALAGTSSPSGVRKPDYNPHPKPPLPRATPPAGATPPAEGHAPGALNSHGAMAVHRRRQPSSRLDGKQNGRSPHTRDADRRAAGPESLTRNRHGPGARH